MIAVEEDGCAKKMYANEKDTNRDRIQKTTNFNKKWNLKGKYLTGSTKINKLKKLF